MVQVAEALRTPGEAAKAFLASHGVIVFGNPDTLPQNQWELQREGNLLRIHELVPGIERELGREAREIDLVAGTDHVSARAGKHTQAGIIDINFPLGEVTEVAIEDDGFKVVGREPSRLGWVTGVITVEHSHTDILTTVLPKSQRR